MCQGFFGCGVEAEAILHAGSVAAHGVATAAQVRDGSYQRAAIYGVRVGHEGRMARRATSSVRSRSCCTGAAATLSLRSRNAAENYSRMMKVVLSLLHNHKKTSGGTKSLARMRKQAAWNRIHEYWRKSSLVHSAQKTKQRKVNKKSRYRNAFALRIPVLCLTCRLWWCSLL